MQDFHIDTRCVQSGYHPENGAPRVVPIVQSTTYKYDSAKDLGDLFDLKTSGYFYTRLGNPTLSAVEGKIAALEGGTGALLTSSGQAATLISLLNICQAGDHVVSSGTIYGGTYNLLDKTLRQMGIEVTFVAPDASEQELHQAFRANTRALFGESLANPAMVVLDIEKMASIAHAHGVPLIVDNTFPTPVHCRPFEWGADIVIHSTTKYMDGHAVALGGVVVDGGRFDWNNGLFPGLCTPDSSYHGIVYTETFGNQAYIVKARTHLMRDLGTAQSPQNAFLLNLGLETLPLRMERHCSNALAVARFLEQHPGVSWINYPELPSSSMYPLARKYMPQGTCGVLSFGVRGGRDAAVRFMESLRMIAQVVHAPPAPPTASSRTHSSPRPASARISCACPSASKTRRTSSPTWIKPWPSSVSNL